MRTYHIEVIGCKVNQYEAQQMSEFLERMNLRPARSAQPADLARFAPKAKLVPEAQDIPTVLCNITSKQGVSDRFSTDIVQGSKATGRNKQCMMTTKAKAAAAGNPVSQIVIKPLSNRGIVKCCV